MIAEHSSVVLTTGVAEHGLRAGDVGAVVSVYQDGKAYEVEFVAGDGSTVAVVTVEPNNIRPVGDAEILHVRDLQGERA